MARRAVVELFVRLGLILHTRLVASVLYILWESLQGVSLSVIDALTLLCVT